MSAPAPPGRLEKVRGRPLAKVCGLTHPDDVRAARDAGADYLGLVFAPSPRRVDAGRAAELTAGAPDARWVGVFSGSRPAEILAIAGRLPLRIVQLHGDEDLEVADALRAAGVETWQAVGVGEPPAWDALQRRVAVLAPRVDAVLLDRRREGRSGGGGVPFRWTGMPSAVREILAGTRFVLSGGIDAANAAAAIRELAPDVVDSSSRLESSPGRKDPERVAAFLRSVRGASPTAVS